MATFTLRAYPAWRVYDRLGTSVMSLPMQSLGSGHRFEARNLAGISEAVAALGKQIKADHPDDSFGIAVIIAKRDRKPNGFDAANHKGGFGQDAWIERRDRDGEPLPAVAGAPAVAA